MDFALEEKKIEGLLETGWQSFVSDDYETALREVETVLLIDDENPMANSLAAACLFRLGRMVEAEPLARNGVRLAPQAALAHVFLAEVLSATEQYDEAESELWEAVSLEPYNAGMHVKLGRFLIARGRLSEARERFERAIEISPEDAEAHLLLGYCLGQAQEFAEAERLLERAHELRPDDDKALVYHGMLCLAQAYILIKPPRKRVEFVQAAYRLRRASELLGRALEINPANQEARDNLEAANKILEHANKLIEAKPRSIRWVIIGGLAGLLVAFFLIRLLLSDSNESLMDTMVPFLIAAAIAAVGYVLYFVGTGRRKGADKIIERESGDAASPFQELDAKGRFEMPADEEKE